MKRKDGIEFFLMSMYMFCFGILSKFVFNMATTNYHHDHSQKKATKDSPYKKIPEIFINFLYFYYAYLSN